MNRHRTIDPQEIASVESSFPLNARRVCELLGEAMPNITSVIFSGMKYSVFSKQLLNTALLSALLRAAPSVQYLSILGGNISHTAIESGLAPNVKHMHIELTDQSNSGTTGLAVRYAESLLTLTVRFLTYNSLDKLFKNPQDGSPVVYSKLHTFKSSSRNGWRYPEDTYTLLTNPFPELRQLVCTNMCPFITSSVFRWIQPTLEVMKVNLHDQTYTQFVNDGVFEANSFPNLRHVNLSWNVINTDISIVNPSRELTRVVSLSPVLEKVVFDTPASCSSSAVDVLCGCKHLRELSLGGTRLTISQAIQLINKFPKLHLLTLSLKTSNDVNERGAVSDTEIKEFQDKNIPLVSSNLRTLGISTFVFTTRQRAAQHMLLLASIFESVSCIQIRSLNEKRDKAILAALDAAKEHSSFDRDAKDQIQNINVALVGK
ncbi:hypothetical protein FBU59_004507 [Linderina macrospora]|uniref:Uncharacterized protein n=1 Tax=Linderina macrospora TaxID=4868 RepID=A0ACC1J5L2_9FUNG|nr:hypothetical protein FBU59_004507 [Linderina macrospora]